VIPPGSRSAFCSNTCADEFDEDTSRAGRAAEEAEDE
jgi:hypothetical protein